MSPMKLFSQGMLGKLGAKDETRKRYFSDETATDSELGNKAMESTEPAAMRAELSVAATTTEQVTIRRRNNNVTQCE